MSNRIIKPRNRRCLSNYVPSSFAFVLLVLSIQPYNALHHMGRMPRPRLERRQDPQTDTPLIIINQCSDDIWPALGTQHGEGPGTNGFKLSPGEQNNLTVSENWQGRVWGRTNCSFNDAGTGPAGGGVGKACASGDCNGMLDCKVGGDVPVSLAEFTLDAGDGQTYYDISLVDGYNIPMAIVVQPLGNASIENIPPNLTNPCCIATFGQLAPQDFDPYSRGQEYLGTNGTYKLPLDQKVSDTQVRDWCPWNLMQNTPQPPSDGVYTYPDNSVEKPAFNPCYSACAKFNLPEDCCTGEHNQPSTCQPSEYSKNIKAVCPDAYSYAFDDQTSTFIIPSGPGFQIIFCPGGRSTTILTVESATVQESGHGAVSYGGGGGAVNDMQGNSVVKNCAGLPVAKAEGGVQAEVAHSFPGMRGNGRYWTRGEGEIEEMEGVEEKFEYEEPLGGVRVLELAERGLHLVDWPRQREMLDRMRNGKRSAATMGGQEVAGGLTWYLMGAGLAVTAGFFINR